MHINFEFKARTISNSELEKLVLQQKHIYKGLDHQKDTYFKVLNGRMKLREGNIENALIHYERKNEAGPKQSDVLLYQHQPDIALKEILTKALGILTVVEKKRKIYFIGNVKIHFDEVVELGNFVEVEAIDKTGSIGLEKLKEQCAFFIDLFRITESQFISESYSDLLAKKSSTA
jgi:adenylate cyclase class 2